MSDEPLWMDEDPIAFARYPFYDETVQMLESVLYLAELKGVTPQEVASMMATLHARSVARLHPNVEQREYVVDVFRRAVISFQNETEEVIRGYWPQYPRMLA